MAREPASARAPLVPPFTYFTSRHEESRIDAAMAEQFADVFRKVDECGDDDHAADFVWIHLTGCGLWLEFHNRMNSKVAASRVSLTLHKKK